MIPMVVVLVIFVMIGAEMRVARWKEISAEAIDPILWFAQKVRFAMTFFFGGSGAMGNVQSFRFIALIENSRVVAAMEILIGLDIKVVREKPSAVAHDGGEQARLLRLAPGPILIPGLQGSRQGGANRQQESQK